MNQLALSIYAYLLDLALPHGRAGRHREGIPASAILARVGTTPLPIVHHVAKPADGLPIRGFILPATAVATIAYCMWLVFYVSGLYR